MSYSYIIIVIMDILYFDKIITDINQVNVTMFKITDYNSKITVFVNNVIGFLPYS